MQKLVWQNANGDTVDLTSTPYGITEWEGFANTSLNIQSQQVPFQDGGVFLDALLEQRELSVTLAMQDNGDLQARYRMRRELIHLLNPKLGEGYLIYTNDFISKRIKCVAQVPLFETHNSNDSGTPKASLAWTACEPYWEDLEETKISLIKGFNTKVTNDGDVDVGFEITALENGSDIIIQNQITKKKLEINKNINGIVVINTNVGKKTVIETNYEAKVAEIGTFSELLNMGNVFIALGGIVAKIDNYDDFDIISEGMSADMGKVLNNLFFGLGNNKIDWSGNGEQWNQTSGYDVAFGNNRYFIPSDISIGYGGKLYDENMQFIAEITISGSVEEHEKVAFSNNMFLTIQGEGTSLAPEQERHYSFEVATSTDGENWTIKTPLVLEDYNIVNLAIGFDNKILIIVRYSNIFYTSDGENWTSLNLDLYINKVLVLENKLYILTNEGIYSGTTVANITKISDKALISITKRNNIYYCITTDYKIEKSIDLVDWGLVQKPFYNDTLNAGVSTDKGLFFTKDLNIIKKVENSSEVLYTEILSWLYLGKITECNNELIVTTSSNILIKSSDYRNFSRFNIVMDSSTGLGKVVYGNGLYIGYYNRKLYSSDNLTNWTLQNTVTSQINDIIFDNFRGIFIAVCNNGKVYTSSNGADWTAITTNTTSYLYCVIATEKQILIGGHNCYLSSFDGINFNYINTYEINADYRNIAYGDGVFLLSRIGYVRIIQEGEYKNSYLVSTNISSTIVLLYYDNKKKIFVFVTFDLLVLELGYAEEGQNIISSLSSNSDLSITLQVGKNEIFIDNTSGNINAVLSYRQKYIGV